MSERARFISFLAASGIAAGVNVAARWLLEPLVRFEVAVALAFVAGLTTGFLLSRLFVFRPQSGRAHWQFARFAMVNAIAFPQVWLVSVGLARVVFPAVGFIWQPETLAHLFGVASPIVSSYMLHKRFSFRSRPLQPPA